MGTNLLVLEYWGLIEKIVVEDAKGNALRALKKELKKSGESGTIVRVKAGADYYDTSELLYEEDSSEEIE